MRLLLIPLLFIVLSGVALLAAGDRLEIPGSFAEAVTWLRSFERWAWLAGMGVIIADFLLPMPSTPAFVGLGIVYGPFVGGLIGGSAATIAGLLAFGLTRSLGERGALFLVGERDLARAQRFYEEWGIYAVVLGRAIGGPAEWLVLIAGISDMAFSRVLGALIVGGFSAAFVNAWLGDLAVERPLLSFTLVVLLAVLVAWLARRMMAASPRGSSRDAAQQGHEADVE